MTVAWGLHNLLEKHCRLSSVYLTAEMSKCRRICERLNGTELLREMLNVTFKAYDNETVSFDSKGDPPGRYEIMNYKIDENGSFKYELVGTWINNQLQIQTDPIWPKLDPHSTENRPIKSVCSVPCEKGQFREVIESKKCCWACKTCAINQIIVKLSNSSVISYESCENCPDGTSPDDDKKKCKANQVIYIQWSSPPCIIAVTMSCIGLILTMVATSIFARFNHTPIVKSSTRELMYVILVGIALCYATTFPLLAKPSMLSCYLIRIMPGMSFSLIFGALVTKTNRICRILSTTKKKIIRHKGRFLSTTSQIVITVILNMIELAIICTMIYLEQPGPIKQYPEYNITRLICNQPTKSLFIPMGFDTILVGFCTWYAFKTRNLPENFNEAKFIGFTMYTTCIIWLGLIPIYFGAEYKVISLCYAITLSAYVALLLLFLPKVYIMLFKPEKNERSAFTTTSDIRCHIGHGKFEYKCTNIQDQKLPKTQPSSTSLQTKESSYYEISQANSNNVYSKSRIAQQHRSCSDDNELINLNDHSQILRRRQISTKQQSIQTNPILIMKNFSTFSTELNSTQRALLDFLESNWNRSDINCERCKQNPNTSEMISYPENSEYYDDIIAINSEDSSEITPLKNHTNLSQEILSTENLSPSKIPSASIINHSFSNRFIEYLRNHGKTFKKDSDLDLVKL